MTPNTTFFLGITVQLILGLLQLVVAIVLVYRWQRRSWQFSNVMNIREPLARAYCSLSAVVRSRARMVEDRQDPVKLAHDEQWVHRYLEAAQDEIVNFSVEHFKARFWLSPIENQQLDVLFDKLRAEWKAVRNAADNPQDRLDDLRREILRFDTICGLGKYKSGQWAHVALHD